MRIGHKDNFLFIEKIGPAAFPMWRFEASILGPGWQLSAVYDRVVVNTSPETLGQITDFGGRRTHKLELELSEGGWLRLKRDARDFVLLRYRVGRLQAGAALEGEIVLEAEAAGPFCRELNTLLSCSPS
jgi:hypothetical protein